MTPKTTGQTWAGVTQRVEVGVVGRLIDLDPDDFQEAGEPENGDRIKQEARERRDVVERAVLAHRADHSEHHGQDDRKQGGQQNHPQCDTEALQQERAHRPAQVLLAEVTVDEVGSPDLVAPPDRVVEMELERFRLQRRSRNLRIGLEEAQGITGVGRHDEDQERRDDQNWNRDQEPTDDES